MSERAETARRHFSDIRADDWVERFLPAAIRPYARLARLDRPIGTWLLLLPCWWGLALAAPGWPDPWLVLVFAIGAITMRGAGCTINDIADREYDAQVERTRSRPLPSGAVTLGQAFVFLALQLAIGLGVLLTLNWASLLLGAASLLLVAIYPFMKRVTYWPQFVLGLAFNWGALLGWAAVTGGLDWPAAVLYVGGIFWTLGYDTIYAHQDKADDIKIGVKSLALKLGERTRPFLALFYAAATLCFGMAGAMTGIAWPFYAALGCGAAQLAWQVARVEPDRPDDCLAKFKSNRLFGLILFAGIAIGRALA
ncbi:MAG: 4-hydroxybenzoate octaprenyltransferase [Alphaproteobacteria bacterium]|nr:4-hydroxybenzoate octaprenyltransferase [Alphaproteobacteria bacterium]